MMRERPDGSGGGAEGRGSPGGSRTTRPGCLALLYFPVLMIAIAWIVLRDGVSGLSESVLGGSPLTSLAAGLLVGAVVSAVLHGTPRVGAFRRMRRFFRKALPGLRTSDVWALALASGIAEEALFRGAIQPSIGLLPASAVFAILHFAPDRRLLGWPVFAGVLGLAFGGVYELTGGNLLGPMVAHVTINLISLRRIRARGP